MAKLYTKLVQRSFNQLNLKIDCKYSKSNQMNLNKKENYARFKWRTADCVCFDVDSTVCTDECIDELAKFANKEKQVQELTDKTMKGDLSFFNSFSDRLKIIQPTTELIDTYMRSHQPKFTPGIQDLIKLLHLRNIDVYLLSGGIKLLIVEIAKELKIPLENVFANTIKFNENGTYAGFNQNEPTAHQDGKARVIRHLKQKHNYQNVVMVGDGVTDLAASEVADLFIGFGGNQIREKVKKEAHWFVISFKELIDELNSNF